MPREKLYESNAERQAAYRARQAERRRLAQSETVAERLGELERAVIEAERRALKAEHRAERAEKRLETALDRNRADRMALNEALGQLRRRY